MIHLTFAEETELDHIIDRIRNGSFARELVDDQRNGHVRLKRLRDAAHGSHLVKVEEAVRRLMNP